MATNTGAPYNLNKFEGGDLVVPALTQQLSENMDKLNNADAVIKVWKPNMQYYSGQLVYAPMSGIPADVKQIIIAKVDHVSSGADTPAEWQKNDSGKWEKISKYPVIFGQDTNIGHADGEMYVDTTEGYMLKRADAGWPDATLATARKMSTSLWALRKWTPNTKYQVGDLVMVSMGSSETGLLTNAVFRAKVQHISSTTFPGSGNSQWDLLNADSAYYRNGNFAAGFGLVMYYFIRGYQMEVLAYKDYKQGFGAQGWHNLNETLPSNVVATDTFFLKGYMESDKGVLYQFNKNRKIIIMNQSDVHAGDWLHGSTYTSVTPGSIVWNSGTPS